MLHFAKIRKAFCLVIGALLIVLYLRIGIGFRFTSSHPSYGHHTTTHPIENLISTAQQRFDKLLARQSRTIQQATDEYQRRYGRTPPAGFGEWFELAQANNFVLIDEFDTLMQSLEPFHGIHPSVLQQRMLSAIALRDNRMLTYKITDGKLSLSDESPEIGLSLTNPSWLSIIPYNMTLAINGFDEPMVSASWDEVEQSLLNAKTGKIQLHGGAQSNITPMLKMDGQSAWAATFHACKVDSPARQIECPSAIRSVTDPLPFISNATLSKDICQNCELPQQEGFLMGPDTLHIAHALVPIWSASKPSTFHDILYPSSYYIFHRQDYRAEEDTAWDEKENVVYWAGSATGGRVNELNWKMMQRQRLVLNTQSVAHMPVQLLEESQAGSGEWTPRFVDIAEIARLFSTKITRVVQCEDKVCEAEREAFGLTGSEGKMERPSVAYKHKFVLDVDGNTFSGRFYRLLQSQSMVIKQTIFKEWHDDRLMPWVHYAPLSTGFDELPEMARFFANTAKGQELGRIIAKESTEWHNRALRDVDLQLVWLRMLLEYGRLMNSDGAATA